MISGASTAGSTRPTEPQVCCRNIATTAISIRVNRQFPSTIQCCHQKDARRQRCSPTRRMDTAGVAETTELWLPDETPAPGSIEGTVATSGPKWRVFDAHG